MLFAESVLVETSDLPPRAPQDGIDPDVRPRRVRSRFVPDVPALARGGASGRSRHAAAAPTRLNREGRGRVHGVSGPATASAPPRRTSASDRPRPRPLPRRRSSSETQLCRRADPEAGAGPAERRRRRRDPAGQPVTPQERPSATADPLQVGRGAWEIAEIAEITELTESAGSGPRAAAAA